MPVLNSIGGIAAALTVSPRELSQLQHSNILPFFRYRCLGDTNFELDAFASWRAAEAAVKILEYERPAGTAELEKINRNVLQHTLGSMNYAQRPHNYDLQKNCS
jgi:hypothetical protein